MFLFSSFSKFAVCLLLFYAKSQSLDRTHEGLMQMTCLSAGVGYWRGECSSTNPLC